MDTLSNGVNIPKLGLGTWMIDDATASDVVRQAVSLGYRHIDTAQAYQKIVEDGVCESPPSEFRDATDDARRRVIPGEVQRAKGCLLDTSGRVLSPVRHNERAACQKKNRHAAHRRSYTFRTTVRR
ncbi:MAG TPA: hypothetical protein GX406_07185 [Pseudoclavibacter sp.]|nr:hypothetical protein [Pseudoclavibacter sp.]